MVGLCETQTVTSPPREGEPAGTSYDDDDGNDGDSGDVDEDTVVVDAVVSRGMEL